MLAKFVSIPIFLASLAIGLFFVYVYVPDSRSVYVYPTPSNINNMQYKDMTGSCYHYEQEEVGCPPSPADISVVPPQS
jgi:hypothetical protein